MQKKKQEKQNAWFKKQYCEQWLPTYLLFILVYPFGLEDLPSEFWKWIVGYEGLYQISNFGRIKSFPRNGTIKEIKILKPKLGQRGYLEISLRKNGQRKSFQIHRLVAQTFIPNPNNLPEVNHCFGNKFDNYFENLEWCTEAENTQHAIKTGLRKIGAERSQAKLTEDDVRWIRSNYKYLDRKYGASAMARKFNMNHSTILDVIHGITYKNVE